MATIESDLDRLQAAIESIAACYESRLNTGNICNTCLQSMNTAVKELRNTISNFPTEGE